MSCGELDRESFFGMGLLPPFSAGIPLNALKGSSTKAVAAVQKKIQFIQLRFSQKNAIVYVTHLEQVFINVHKNETKEVFLENYDQNWANFRRFCFETKVKKLQENSSNHIILYRI